MAEPQGLEPAPTDRAENNQRELKCPRCRTHNIAASRRRTSWEEWSALWGRNYYRCGACDIRFSLFGGIGESASYYEKMFILRRVAGKIALVCAIVALVVLATVGVDLLINGRSSGPSFRK